MPCAAADAGADRVPRMMPQNFRRKESGCFQFWVVGNHLAYASGVSWRDLRNKGTHQIFHVTCAFFGAARRIEASASVKRCAGNHFLQSHPSKITVYRLTWHTQVHASICTVHTCMAVYIPEPVCTYRYVQLPALNNTVSAPSP